ITDAVTVQIRLRLRHRRAVGPRVHHKRRTTVLGSVVCENAEHVLRAGNGRRERPRCHVTDIDADGEWGRFRAVLYDVTYSIAVGVCVPPESDLRGHWPGSAEQEYAAKAENPANPVHVLPGSEAIPVPQETRRAL